MLPMPPQEVVYRGPHRARTHTTKPLADPSPNWQKLAATDGADDLDGWNAKRRKLASKQVDNSSGAALVRRIRAELAAEGLEPTALRRSFCRLRLRCRTAFSRWRSASPTMDLTSRTKSGMVHLHQAAAESRQTPKSSSGRCCPVSRWRMSRRRIRSRCGLPRLGGVNTASLRGREAPDMSKRVPL